MKLYLDPRNIDDYHTMLKVKGLPTYRIRGRCAEFPDEYAARLGMTADNRVDGDYRPHPELFDYQRDIARMAIAKRRFAVFADCGLGKTLIYIEFVRHALRELPTDRAALIVSPLMVIDQTIAEAERFYGDTIAIEKVASRDTQSWLTSGTGRLGITNYESFREPLAKGRLGCLVLDESSMLKSHYGKYGRGCIELGKGIEWKMAGTGTPAPNDRIEYANHAVFLDEFPTVNSFLARYFVNRGQTNERWELKPHALRPFYRSLSHWSIFLSDPAVYGWKDNTESLPPIHVHIEDVELTEAQHVATRKETGMLVPTAAGGITKRSALARIAKGKHRGHDVATNKYDYIADMLAGFDGESTIIWCLFNDEQDRLAKMLPAAASISGTTPHEKRMELIDDFKAGRRKVLISKPKILGYGLNLQVCTRMIFSSLQDSYESFYQAVKRANRYGSTKPLNVHVPITDLERPMVENVLRKAHRVHHDTAEQEKLFRESTE